MDCRDAQFYLRFRRPGSDEFDPEVGGELDRHLAGCPHCAAEARADAAFDAAVTAAMRDVPVPAGLRNRLVAHVAAQRGAALRRRVTRYASVAAAVLLAVGIGFGAFGSRPELDLYALVSAEAQQDRQPEETVRKWLTAQKLPADLPYPFDYALLKELSVKEVQGREVPVIVFAARGTDSGFAKVYIFRVNQFRNLKDLQGAVGESNCQAVVYDDPENRYRELKIVVVHTLRTGPDLTPFLKAPGTIG
jgi:hypothetical protein